MASVEELGADSPFVKLVDEDIGLTALHVLAINGYEELFKAFVEKGGMDPTVMCDALASMVTARFESVRGPDCYWMAKRRGHKKLVKYITSVPAMKTTMDSLAKEVRDAPFPPSPRTPHETR